ncbi:Ybl055cp-like protein [Candida albicans P78042]|nr:Ybl055cp-like protein [Candida albicans P78042]
MINPRRFLTIMTRTKFWKPRYYDIGVNFSDSMFQGYYNGSTTSKHPCDIQSVI